jgi:hypothetical protein
VERDSFELPTLSSIAYERCGRKQGAAVYRGPMPTGALLLPVISSGCQTVWPMSTGVYAAPRRRDRRTRKATVNALLEPHRLGTPGQGRAGRGS